MSEVPNWLSPDHDSDASAEDAARTLAVRTGGDVFPCVVLEQAGRTAVTTVMSFAYLRVRFSGKPANTQLPPLVRQHSDDIAAYVASNPDAFTLPSLTMAATDGATLFISASAPSRGWVHLSTTASLRVIDGQHRVAAITGVQGRRRTRRRPAEGLPSLGSIPTMIFFGMAGDEIDQAIADCAVTWSLPPGLLLLFDQRDPISRIARAVLQQSWLAGRVDMESLTLPKLSRYLFQASAVRTMVTAAVDRLPGATEQVRDELVVALGILSTHMKPWDELSLKPKQPTGAVAALREQYVNLSAGGLAVIGAVVGEVARTLPSEQRLEAYHRLANLDWRRGADLWSGSLVLKSSKRLKSSDKALVLATSQILPLVGLRS